MLFKFESHIVWLLPVLRTTTPIITIATKSIAPTISTARSTHCTITTKINPKGILLEMIFNEQKYSKWWIDFMFLPHNSPHSMVWLDSYKLAPRKEKLLPSANAFYFYRFKLASVCELKWTFSFTFILYWSERIHLLCQICI